MNVTHRRGTVREIQGSQGLAGRLAADAQENGFHIESHRAAAGLDGALHLVQRMVQKQVQDTDVVFDALGRAVLALQGAA